LVSGVDVGLIRYFGVFEAWFGLIMGKEANIAKSLQAARVSAKGAMRAHLMMKILISAG
jgi:hypothetical protein